MGKVPIRWAQAEGYAELGAWGRIERQDEVTGDDGIARLVVRLHDEVIPGVGQLERRDSVLRPPINWRSLFSPVAGFIRERVDLLTLDVGPPVDVEFPFSLSRHHADGYAIDWGWSFDWYHKPHEPHYVLVTPGVQIRETFIQCVEQAPWQLAWRWTAVGDPPNDHYLSTWDAPVPVPFAPGARVEFQRGVPSQTVTVTILDEGRTAAVNLTWVNDPMNDGYVPPGVVASPENFYGPFAIPQVTAMVREARPEECPSMGIP